MVPTLEAAGLTKRYRMGELEVAALQGVDLTLRPGELVVLLGPSGSGKSTLLNILGGLDSPTSGTLSFGDVELTAADEATLTRYRREEVGFVFQFYNLIPSLTAAENVALITDLAERPMPVAAPRAPRTVPVSTSSCLAWPSSWATIISVCSCGRPLSSVS